MKMYAEELSKTQMNEITFFETIARQNGKEINQQLNWYRGFCFEN